MARTSTVKLPPLNLAEAPKPKALRSRGRSNSIVKVEHVGDRVEEVLDRNVYVNINADWVNAKGAWLIHVVLILCGKICIDTIPGMTQQISWTLVNLMYLAVSYLMFHWVTGIPFGDNLHSGAYDELTLWEQIDDALFLASTHYTNYNPWLFAINLTTLVFVLIPKLPQLHRQRVRFMADDSTTASGMATPTTPSFPSGVSTPLVQITAADFTESRFK